MSRSNPTKFFLLLLIGIPAITSTPAPGEPEGQFHAVIVEGLLKDPEEVQSRERSLLRLKRLLGKYRSEQVEGISILVPSESFVRDPDGESNRNTLLAKLEEVRQKTTDRDLFLFYYMGQSNPVGDSVRLNLPGPDIGHEDLLAALSPIQAGTRVFVFDAPCAGVFVETLSSPESVVITASRSDQPNGTRWSEWFVPAFSTPEADTDGNGVISLLEAFSWSRKQVDDFYESNSLMKSETALLEDDGDGTPSQNPNSGEEETDGRLASRTILFPSDQE